jgi:hypothetical protein
MSLDDVLVADAEAWVVLRALLDEFPTLHASLLRPRGALTVDPADVVFVARNSEIALLREWLRAFRRVPRPARP